MSKLNHVFKWMLLFFAILIAFVVDLIEREEMSDPFEDDHWR